ncbi:hypothetical protein DSO57_1033106 [Entomophthora muscae]|uniref:Uncharacterized protein n=1 Tax=Entomophthora muscae TaxID=34485 RepID=A0ACC2TY19_9FUNG|nr:hypothetical protein DSO57_1033106 [Entomophthora muscae]
MTPPLTLRPDCPQESVTANESTSTQIFGVMLAPFIWWALSAGPAGCLPASSQETPTGWIPDTDAGILAGKGLEELLILQEQNDVLTLEFLHLKDVTPTQLVPGLKPGHTLMASEKKVHHWHLM